METTYKTMPAYQDAHCAGFCGWPMPKARDQLEQQAIDRGYWDGLKARERATENGGH